MFTSHVLMATMTFVNPSAMMEAVSDAWLQLWGLYKRIVMLYVLCSLQATQQCRYKASGLNEERKDRLDLLRVRMCRGGWSEELLQCGAYHITCPSYSSNFH